MKNCIFSRKLISVIMAGSLIVALSAILPEEAFARGHSRNVARSHVNNYNRGGHRDVNKNINRNINVDRDVHVHGGYYGGYRGGYYYGDRHNHGGHHHGGVSTGAAVAIGLSALAIGTIIGASQMPPASSCTTVAVQGVAYRQCGNTWYQPQYAGSQVNYVVVNPPY